MRGALSARRFSALQRIRQPFFRPAATRAEMTVENGQENRI